MADLGEEEVELDPGLAQWLAEAREDGPEPPIDCGALLGRVEEEIAAADEKPSFRLKALPTWTRRAIALGAAAVMVVIGGALRLRPNIDAPARMAFAVAALGLLLVLSVHQALRPLYRPALPRWQRASVTFATLLATFLVTLLPAGHSPEPGVAGVCFTYGLLFGVPVYLVLRLLERRPTLSSLLGACAAGLAGNLILTLHCPSDDLRHLLLGHFSVAVVFVAGLALVHLVTRRRAAPEG